MKLKCLAERLIIPFPKAHLALLMRRPRADLNKLAFVFLLRPGQVVCDVGANVGHYTELFARKVNSGGMVFAFEPVSETFQHLSARCNRLRNVRVVQAGLAEVDGPATIYVPSEDFGQASLATHRAGSWSLDGPVTEFSIGLLKLDTFIAREGISRIDFIKVDIEGAELRFISGAEQTLKRFRPLLYMEISEAWLAGFGARPLDVVEALRDLSYTRIFVSRIKTGRYSLEKIEVNQVECGDYLFLPDGASGDFTR